MTEYNWRSLDVALDKALKRVRGLDIKDSGRCWLRGLEFVDIEKDGSAFCRVDTSALGIHPLLVTHAPTGVVRECADFAAAVESIVGWADTPPSSREIAEFRRQVAANI